MWIRGMYDKHCVDIHGHKLKSTEGNKVKREGKGETFGEGTCLWNCSWVFRTADVFLGWRGRTRRGPRTFQFVGPGGGQTLEGLHSVRSGTRRFQVGTCHRTEGDMQLM